MKNAQKIFLLGLVGVLSACAKGVHCDSDAYRNVMDYKEHFEVCCLSDIHLSLISDTDYEFNYLKHVIYSKVLLENVNLDIETASKEELKPYAPDVIVLNGDVFQTGDKSLATRFFSWIDTLDIPFAYTYGNHDLHALYGQKFVEKQLMKCKNSLLKNPNDDVFGNANYFVDLKQGNEVKWQLYILDSNTYYGLDYDVVHDDQIEWYKSMVLEANKAPNLTFFHIPFEEFEEAWNTLFYGRKHGYDGTSDCWMEDTGVAKGYRDNDFFETMEELGATKGVICAHDHTNNTDFHFSKNGGDPIRLIYGTKTGHGIYHDKRIMGGDFYILNNDGTFSRRRVNVQYDSFDAFVMDSEYINRGGK